jgi:hypothetical protein
MVGAALLLHGGRGIGSWWWLLVVWVGASYERRGAQRRFPANGYNGWRWWMVMMSGCSGGWEGWEKLRERERERGERGGGIIIFFGGKTRVCNTVHAFKGFF